MRKILYVIVIFGLSGIMMCCHENERFLTAKHLDKAEGSPKEALTYLENLNFAKLDKQQQVMYHLTKAIAEERLYKQGYKEEQHIQDAKKFFEEKGDYEMVLKSLYMLGRIHDHLSDPTKAVNNYLEGLAIAKHINSPYWMFHFYAKIGMHYLTRYDPAQAHAYMEEALRVWAGLDMSQLGTDAKVVAGKIYLYSQNYDEALCIFEDILATLAPDDYLQGPMLQSLSIIYCRKKDWKSAIFYAEQASRLSLKEDDYMNCLILVYSHYYSGNKKEALKYKDRLDKDTIRNINIGQQYNQICARIYEEQENYEKALFHLKRAAVYEDSMISVLGKSTIDELILRYNKNILTDRNDKLVQENWMLILAFVVWVSLTILLYKLSRKKHIMDCCLLDMRIETLVNMQKQTEKEQDYLREIILRDLELSKRIALFKNRQTEKSQSFFKEFDRLFFIGRDNPFELKWDTFYQHINYAFAGFYTRLIERYPQLCEKEIQLCCLTLVKFKTDEIAAVWNQSIFSVQKYRSNIRKKTNMPEGGDIIECLQKNLSS